MVVLRGLGEMARYLDGAELTDVGLFAFPGPHDNEIIGRNDLLARLCSGKSVLHVGCADHVEIIARRRADGTYLHDVLLGCSREVVGVDTNSEALNVMRSLGIKDVYTPDKLPARSWDVVLVPDVIEHVGNVAQFLADLGEIHADQFVFTTPNVFALSNRKRFSVEANNSDHRYWFSPYTLARTLHGGGFRVTETLFTGDATRWHPLRYWLKRRYPLCRSGLVAIATKPR